MVAKLVRICAILIAVCALSSMRSTRAEEGGHRVNSFVREILNHADDLNLTADQKSKLSDLVDTPTTKGHAEWLRLKEKIQAILTKDQFEKLMETVYKRREEHAHATSADDNDDHK